jgi:hypothetical protein
MSDLLNSASLVMIPSGYKEDIVYSAVPTDGSGDLSFTRSSNGTRINSAGLVEVCPWNELTYSQQIQNADWNVLGGDLVVTANAVISPDGTQNAGAITLANSANRYFVHNILGLTGGIPYTYSVYMKSASGNLSVNMGGVNGLAGVMKTVTTEWQRFTYTFTPATSYGEYFGFDNRGAGSSTSGTLYFWGAQLNIGSTAKPYFPTTDRLNVPRLTYQNGGGGCPSLLLEKQSTNLFTYSEQLDNAAWTKNNTTVTANATTSPDGTSNADKIADSINTSSAFYFYQSPATTSTQYTSSGYFKKGEYNFVTLHAFGLNGAVFNLNTGVLVSQSGGTGTIQSVGDGWYRCTFTFTAGGSAVFFSQSPAGNISYTGTIGSGIYGWGLQCEASSYFTSYIPTTSASATRVADACSKTGISSLIGQTEGTVLWDVSNVFQTSGDGARLFVYTDGNNFILISPYANTLRILIVSSGTAFDNFITISGTSLKIAVAYKANDYKFYVNGVSVGTPTATSVPAMNSIGIVNDSSGSAVSSQSETKQLLLFKTRLTNAELASLTTL